jgi:GAF domain-containing protein
VTLKEGEKTMADAGGVLDDLVPGFVGVAQAVLSADTEQAILQRVVDTAVATIEGCDLAGITVFGEHGVTTSSHSHPTVIEIDAVQHASAEGPCLDAVSSSAAVYAGDLADDARYPTFGAHAATAGIRSALAFPVRSDEVRGALNLYARLPHAYGATDRGKGVILAMLAGVALTSVAHRHAMEQRNVNLQQAMLYREVIGQAQGILMEREHITADQAFAILRRASQHLNEKLRDVARTLVETGQVPDGGEEPRPGTT